MPSESRIILEWLEKVTNDLRAAEVDLAADPPLLEDSVFHCQQAFEKSLKAFLVSCDVEFMKSHDLSYLLNLCVSRDDAFEQWR